MESRVKLLGHPVHPILIPFPIGLLVTSVVFDLARLARPNPEWGQIAYWMIVCGVVGGLAAAVFGAIDWLAIPRQTRAWRIGLLHGVGNVVAVALCAASWWLRSDLPEAPPTLAIALSFIGVGFLGFTGWLGGELVARLGVGVSPGAGLDAPSSLSAEPLSDSSTGTRLTPRVSPR